ncbi:lysozyme inhibitor LprI family protein [Psychroflexus gondwanensis]|uniref:lysozyme inhibitor LprI family protein n=1 Tax=Psychroflexus gondwanensis TaxID=251 RepID=UPI003744190B
MTEYKSEPIFIERLKNAQRVWISCRDAELEMKFPAENKQLEYGSVYPVDFPLLGHLKIR